MQIAENAAAILRVEGFRTVNFRRALAEMSDNSKAV
jgi:hypothetical protein